MKWMEKGSFESREKCFYNAGGAGPSRPPQRDDAAGCKGHTPPERRAMTNSMARRCPKEFEVRSKKQKRRANLPGVFFEYASISVCQYVQLVVPLPKY